MQQRNPRHSLLAKLTRPSTGTYRSRTHLSFGLLLLFLFAHQSSATAELINIDFGDDLTGLPTTYGAASGQVGSWNDILFLGTTAGLLDTSGSTTDVSVTVASENPSGQAGDAVNDDERLLFDNFFSSSSTGWTVHIVGLDDGIYDLFVYAPANTIVSTGPFTVNGAAQPNLSGAFSLIQGTSWAAIIGVNVSGGVLTIANVDTSGFRGLAGIQIRDSLCGNGTIDIGEDCDDGNAVDGDGCDSNCTPTACGNGVLTAAEECDDGNSIDGDGCSAVCIIEFCGDGVIQAGIGEQCDDGNAVDGDGCDSNCTPTACGNGVLTAAEECDDGNSINGDGCSAVCVIEFCGDGMLQLGLGEQCDDANLIDGDGCDSDCAFTLGTTQRVSVDSSEIQANDGSIFAPRLSADGRFVAFAADATNLVGGDTNGFRDAFLRDRYLGITERVSVSATGAQGNSNSSGGNGPDVSASGGFVAFSSSARNLVAGDTNFRQDIFVRDRAGATTRPASFNLSGGGPNNHSDEPTISPEGTRVAFSSFATDIVSGDTNGVRDVFMRVLPFGINVLISQSSGGVRGDGESLAPAISLVGETVAFYSLATNLGLGDTNGFGDVFVRDTGPGVTERVAVSTEGTQGDCPSSGPAISWDGRIVAFVSCASNLVADDTNNVVDIFVHDRDTGVTERVSLDSAGAETNGGSIRPSLSANGRFVGFESDADNLVPGDTNGVKDVFVHDRLSGTTIRASVSSTGEEANGRSFNAGLSPDGSVVAFVSLASNLVSGDTNNVGDVFAHVLGLTPPDCGDGVLDPGEECDDGNTAPGDCCSRTCEFELAGTVCRPSAGVCDVAESCDGVSGACPADGFEPATTVCQASAGVCDLEETCTGTGAVCPADAKSTAECRAAADVCDAAESCDGLGDSCPADGFEAPTTECRASAGACDLAESCTGTSSSCPADAKSTAECRASAGVCDPTESCDGVNNDCPGDGFVTGTECRASTGDCDPAESCEGSGPACPPDTVEPDGTSCDDGNVCTTPDECQSGICVGNFLICGNGTVEASCGEECDDGNNSDGDCCSSTCKAEDLGTQTCGRGVCEQTVDVCVNGQPQPCTPASPTETPEVTCDDLADNDCDGAVDCSDADCSASAACARGTLSKADQKCVNEVNKNVEKLGRALGGDICRCIKDGSKGKLPQGQTIEDCIVSDIKGKVAKASRKLSRKVADRCASYDPNFPTVNPDDPNAIIERVRLKELSLIHWIFGSDLDAPGVIKDFETEKDDAKCQQAIAKQAKKCQSRKLKVYNACKKDKLKGKGVPQAQSALDVQVACLQDDPNDPTTGIPDPKNSIQKDCTDKLLGAINGKCAGADLGDLFQGCVPAPANAAELQNCVDYMVECEVCLLLNEIDGLTRDCDDFDDGMANGSCTIGVCDTSGVCGHWSRR